MEIVRGRGRRCETEEVGAAAGRGATSIVGGRRAGMKGRSDHGMKTKL
jgi:hypothetical protein